MAMNHFECFLLCFINRAGLGKFRICEDGKS